MLVYTPTTTSTTCAVEDRDDRTLQSVTRSWDEIFLHTSTAFHTTVAFQLGQLPELEKLALPQDAVRRLLFDTPKWQHLWCRHCHLQVQFCRWLCRTTSCPLPHGGLCRTANMQSWPSGTTPANVSHLRRFSMTCCSKICRPKRQALHPCCWVSLTRSSRPTTCKEPTVAQLPRAYIWKNQNDDCPVPCVGSHLSV